MKFIEKVKRLIGMNYTVFERKINFGDGSISGTVDYMFEDYNKGSTYRFQPHHIKRLNNGVWLYLDGVEMECWWSSIYNHFRYDSRPKQTLKECLILWDLPKSYENEIKEIFKKSQQDKKQFLKSRR